MIILPTMRAAMSGFSPLSLSPALWLDAGDASTLYDATTGGSLVAPDGAVARWEDKSGSGRHVIQASATAKPLRKISIQNGRDVLRFDGSNDGMRCADNSPFSGSSFAITVMAVVIRRSSLLNYSSILSQSASAVDQALSMGCFLSQGSRICTDRWRPAGRQTQNGNQLGLGTPTVISWVCPIWGSNQSATSIYVNGVNQATLSYGTTMSTSLVAGPFTVGHWEFSRIDMGWPGDIAELIVFLAAMSDENRGASEKYLLRKWGI